MDVAALANIIPQRVADFIRLRRINAQTEENIADAIVVLHAIQSVIHPAKFVASTPEKVAAAQALVHVYIEKKQAEAQATEFTA